MTDSAKDIIVGALMEFSGGVDDMLYDIAQAQADRILTALATFGYAVVTLAEPR